jgi:serralysin
MANQMYIIDELAVGPETVTVIDDGTGIDWLVFSNAVYASPTDIRLGWTVEDGSASSASGFFFITGNDGRRLVVEGLIENVRATNGVDAIQGNEVANLIYGDQTATGLVGGNDTIGAGAGNDTVYGGSGADSVDGGADNDLLFGNTGNDTISGGAGRDTVNGGIGADSLSGGATDGDTVSYFGSTAGVTVRITFGSTTTGAGGDAAGDQLNGFDAVIGSNFDDIIVDTVKGTVAFGGNDNVFAGAIGDDTLRLGGGDDRGDGGLGNDMLFGEDGNDSLTGSVGADTLTGGVGQDRLNGGAGADQFVFIARTHSTTDVAGRDIIVDFSHDDHDKIDLRTIDAITGGANDHFTFVGRAAFSGAAGELRLFDTGPSIVVQVDVNGDKTADFAIMVLNEGTLLAGDFLL